MKELSSSPDPDLYKDPQKVLIRPAGYYTLVYAAPDDAGICNRLLAAMDPEFIAKGPFYRAMGDNSDIDYLGEAAALFMGSPGLREPWRLKRRDNPRHGVAYLAFQQADINGDGAPDRLYRSQGSASPLPPTDDYNYHSLYIRLGNRSGPEPRDEVTYDDVTSSENESGFVEFDLYKAQVGPHPHKPGQLHSFWNYGLYESESDTYLLAASPRFPVDEKTALYLFKFIDAAPYFACELRGNVVIADDLRNQPETAFGMAGRK